MSLPEVPDGWKWHSLTRDDDSFQFVMISLYGNAKFGQGSTPAAAIEDAIKDVMDDRHLTWDRAAWREQKARAEGLAEAIRKAIAELDNVNGSRTQIIADLHAALAEAEYQERI